MAHDGRTAAGVRRWGCKHQGTNKTIYCYTTTRPDLPYRNQGGETKKADENPRFHRKLDSKIIVITSAQNATPTHIGFETLKHYCESRGAELIVHPLRYKNATSQWTASQENAEWWVSEVQPYLYNQRKKLNDNLVLLADIKVVPTRVHPLRGMEAYTHGESGILGHNKLHMFTVPTPQGKLPKVMTTTGTCTVKNYTDTGAGKSGEHNHCYGAVVVEIVNRKTFHMRHILWDNKGVFIDLDKEYHPDGTIRPAPPAEALILGDQHEVWNCKKTDQGTWGPDGLVAQLKPKTVVWHDVLDFYSRGHHERDNPFLGVAKHRFGMENVEAEVARAVNFVAARTRGDAQSVIVSSNHHDHLARWLREVDWRDDPVNAEFYLSMALDVVRSVKQKPGSLSHEDPFHIAFRRVRGDLVDAGKVRLLNRDEAFLVKGIDCGQHGHLGPNGARGSRMSLRRIGVKTVIMHSHGPGIEEGCWQGGTGSELGLGYVNGPSGHLNTHCVIYATGKRALITFIGGEYRMREK